MQLVIEVLFKLAGVLVVFNVAVTKATEGSPLCGREKP